MIRHSIEIRVYVPEWSEDSQSVSDELFQKVQEVQSEIMDHYDGVSVEVGPRIKNVV